ncbi:N-acetylglucosamine kinase [Lysinibacillus antri]|uniref:ATPase BadF/BadG/BcrA/BcrD type domain-containing protein n=1 Tax=Lysinibacillus antri TaxID=2498145 RepID=A0A432L7M8_9BACI|nr:BadF/BadG/BcrA/BcrD ATPase family protein [Lysinibacillus antri]RUL47801.1 hypothetical protein EK386_17865 [Lysinibacillus antri]
MTEKVILAVDGGATKTTLAICSQHGDCYFKKTSTGSNYQTIGKDKVQQVISALLHDAYESTKLKNINVAAFAMAGIDTHNDQLIVEQLITSCLEQSAFSVKKCIAENDVHATLLGLVGVSQRGALIISGTGALSYAVGSNGELVRTGGWGHRAGDEGSGYWIGQQIVKSLFRIEDGRNEKLSILKQFVYDKLNIQNAEQLMTWLYRPEYTNAQLASISSVLPKAVAAGDEQAIAIAQQAALELSILASSTLKKVGTASDDYPVYLNGGVFQHHPMILNLFQQYINEQYPRISFTLCKKEPIEYIIMRALHEIKGSKH